jgi:hypothetical protein
MAWARHHFVGRAGPVLLLSSKGTLWVNHMESPVHNIHQ